MNTRNVQVNIEFQQNYVYYLIQCFMFCPYTFLRFGLQMNMGNNLRFSVQQHVIFFRLIADSSTEMRWKNNTDEEQHVSEYYARNQSTSSWMMHEAGLDYLEPVSTKVYMKN